MEPVDRPPLHSDSPPEPDRDRSRSRSGTHALVIGGSIAGLLAARVLVDHFDRVTVVERDRLPSGPEHRAGVPQARQVHALLVQGYRLLNELFPGLEAELAAAGAPRVDWQLNFPVLHLGGWSPRYPSDLVSHTCSRALLEYLIGRRLTAYPNLTVLQGYAAVGLLHDDERRTVTGIRVRARGQEQGNHPQEIRGDLVVDASGRTSRTPEWLEALGYARPDETVINAFLGYATRWYRRPRNVGSDWKGLLVGMKPPDERRGGVIYPVEEERWIVTLAGLGRDYPPTDEAGFLEFARSIRTPLLYDAISEAEPLTPISGYQRTENCLRHYERLDRWPEGFVVLGDAACAFNPVYGQGMTVAALEAVALGHLLEERKYGSSHDLSGLSGRFQQRLATIVGTPWMMATGEDLRWLTTEGDRPRTDLMTRLLHRYIDQILTTIPGSPTVHGAFVEVAHLMRPPSRLFYPDVALRVGWHALVQRGRGWAGP